MRTYEQAATVTGVLLRERKRRCSHGEWLPWLAANFEGSKRTAQVYIEQAEVAFPNAQAAAHLEAPAEPVAELSALFDPMRAAGVDLEAQCRCIAKILKSGQHLDPESDRLEILAELDQAETYIHDLREQIELRELDSMRSS